MKPDERQETSHGEPNRRSAAVPNDLEAFWVPFTPNRAFNARRG